MEPPMVTDPDYKGEWKPKQIDNHAYKGKWVNPEIDNPDNIADLEICQHGGDWLAEEVGNETWGATKDPEKMTDSQEEERNWMQKRLIKRREKRMKNLTLNTKLSCKPELLKRNPVYYDPLAQG